MMVGRSLSRLSLAGLSIVGLAGAFLLAAPVKALEPGDCAVLQRSLGAGMMGVKVSLQAEPANPQGCGYRDVLIDLPHPQDPDIRIRRIFIAGDQVMSEGGDLALRLTLTGVEALAPRAATRPPATADIDLVALWKPAARSLDISSLFIAFSGDSSLLARARIENVDLGTMASAQASLLGFRISDLDLQLDSRQLFQSHIAPLLAGEARGPLGWREEVLAALPDLPQSSLSPASSAALRRFLAALPAENGLLTVNLTAAQGFGPLNLLPLAVGPVLLGGTRSRADLLATALSGTRIEIGWN